MAFKLSVAMVLFLSIMKFSSQRNIFTLLRQGYPVSVLKCFRKLLKCRSKRVSVKLEIQFLRQCVEEGVAPRWLTTRVRKAKVKYSRKMEVAFLQDEINFKEDLLCVLQKELTQRWRAVWNALCTSGKVYVSAFVSDFDQRKQDLIASKYRDQLRRLSKERFGRMAGNHTNSFVLFVRLASFGY